MAASPFTTVLPRGHGGGQLPPVRASSTLSGSGLQPIPGLGAAPTHAKPTTFDFSDQPEPVPDAGMHRNRASAGSESGSSFLSSEGSEYTTDEELESSVDEEVTGPAATGDDGPQALLDGDRHDIGSISNYVLYFNPLRPQLTEDQERIFETFDMVVVEPTKIDQGCRMDTWRVRNNAILGRMFFRTTLRRDLFEEDDIVGATQQDDTAAPGLGMGGDLAKLFAENYDAKRSSRSMARHFATEIQGLLDRGFDGIVVSGVNWLSCALHRDTGRQHQHVVPTPPPCSSLPAHPGLAEAVEDLGSSFVETSLLMAFKEVAGSRENGDEPPQSPCQIVLDMGDIAASSPQLRSLILRLRVAVNAVLITGLTINPATARARLPHTLKHCQSFLKALQYELQERVDFGILALERVDDRDAVKPELPGRFWKFCQEYNFVGWMSVGTVSHQSKKPQDAGQVARVTGAGEIETGRGAAEPLTQGVGPIGLMDSFEVQRFWEFMHEKTRQAGFSSERYRRLRRAVGYRVADAARDFQFDPTQGDAPASVDTEAFVERLIVAYIKQLEQVPAEDGGQQVSWGTDAHAAWLNVAAQAFSQITDEYGAPHALSEIGPVLSQLEKKALERPDSYIVGGHKFGGKQTVTPEQAAAGARHASPGEDVVMPGQVDDSGASESGAAKQEPQKEIVDWSEDEEEEAELEDSDEEREVQKEMARQEAEKDRAKADVLAFDTAGVFLQAVRPGGRRLSFARGGGQRAELGGKGKDGGGRDSDPAAGGVGGALGALFGGGGAGATVSNVGGTGGPRLSGQKEFGYRHRLSQFSHVVKIQHDLRVAGLLGNISQAVTREVYTGDTDKNDMKLLPDDQFLEALSVIENAINFEGVEGEKRQQQNQHIIDAFKRDPRRDKSSTIVTLIRQLASEMQEAHPSHSQFKKVQIWESDKAGLKYVSGDGHETRYEAVSEIDQGVFHVYVRKGHANYASAIVHQYLQKCGMTNTQCVIAEGMVRKHNRQVAKWMDIGADPVKPLEEKEQKEEVARDASSGTQSLTCVGDRLLDQIDNSSVMELMGFIQRTRKQELVLLRRTDLSVLQRSMAVRIAREVGAAAHQRLLTKSMENTDLEVLFLSEELPVLTKADGLWYDLAALIREAAWRPKQTSKFRAVLQVLTAGMRELKTWSNAGLIMKEAMYTVGRDAALSHLQLAIRDVTPYVVREADVCTIYCEMGGSTDADIRRQLHLSKHDVGKALWARIRGEMREEDYLEPPVVTSSTPPNPYEKPVEEVLGNREYIRNFADGLFFMFPFFINLILVLTLKTGIFTSTFMNQTHQNLSGVAIVIAFIAVGGVNSAIARCGSYYLYQWSFAVMLVILSRLLWAGILVTTIMSTAGFLVALAWYPVADALVLFGYAMLFGLLQLLIACLYNSHKGSIWMSVEGWAIIGGIGIATLLVLLLLFVAQLDAIICHFISLGVTVTFLLIMYWYVVHHTSIIYETLAPTSDVDVMNWYHTEHGGPQCPPKKKNQSEQDAAVVEWLRNERGLAVDSEIIRKTRFLAEAKKESVRTLREARAAFAVEVLQARKLGKKRLMNVHPLVRARAANYLAEESLVHWYVLLTAKDRPFPATDEWDVLLKEGLKTMGVKQRTDVVHRGGILWEMSRAYAAHGAFYFALMFVDRILRVFGGAGATFFVPTTPYELGVGWAQVFLLIAVGALEPLVHRKSAALESCQHLRVGRDISLSTMLGSRSKQHHAVYLSEMWLCLRFTILSIGASLGFLFFFSPGEVDIDVLWVWGAACIGYLGFLVGGFNMLFLSGAQHQATRAISRAFLIGLVSGGVVMLVMYYIGIEQYIGPYMPRTTYLDFSVVGIMVGGSVYGWFSIPKPGKDDKMSPTYDFASKAPLMTTAMQTSGQRWIQVDTDPEITRKQEKEKLNFEAMKVIKKVDEEDPFALTQMRSGNVAMAALAERLSKLRSATGISPDTGVGREAAGILRRAVDELERQPATSLIRRAFPNGDFHLEQVLKRWIDGTTEVMMVPEKYLVLPNGLPFSALSRIVQVDSDNDGEGGLKSMFKRGGMRKRKGVKKARRKPMWHEHRTLQIFVGVDKGRPTEKHAQQLAEALVHETFEQIFGMSHSFAVCAEMLVCPPNAEYTAVPARIMAELQATPDKVLMRMDDKTDDCVLQHSLINMDQNTVDLQWNFLNDNTRHLIVGLLESVNPNFNAPALTPIQLRAHVRLSAKQMRRAIRQLTGDPPIKHLWDRRLALGELSCRLGVAVKQACRKILNLRHVQRSERHQPIAFQSLTAGGGAWWDPLDPSKSRAELKELHKVGAAFYGKLRDPFTRRMLMRMDTFFRLFSMAATADPAFQAEKSYACSAPVSQCGVGWFLGLVLRFPITWLYLISRKCAEWMIWLPLKLWRPRIRRLVQQLESGLNRTRVLDKQGRLHRIVRQNPENPRVGFLHYDLGDSKAETKKSKSYRRPTSVHVYSGTPEQEPLATLKGRSHIFEYTSGRVSRSLETAGKAIKKTVFYGFPGEADRGAMTLHTFFIPKEKRVYRGSIDDESQVDAKQLDSVVRYDKVGRIVSAKLYRSYELELDSLSRDKKKDKRPFVVHAVFDHPERVNPGDSVAWRHIYSCQPEDDSDETIMPFHQIEVIYHEFSKFVSEVWYRRTPTSDPLVTRFIYKHISHPELKTYIIPLSQNNGSSDGSGMLRPRRHETPLAISQDSFQLLNMDPASSVYEEDLLAPLPKQKVSRELGWKQRLLGTGQLTTEAVFTSPYSTRKARTVLWMQWGAGKIEGVYAQLMDEKILRREPVLKPYWRMRDWGLVGSARRYVIEHEGDITAVISFSGSNSHLVLRVPDLLTFGQGGSSHHNGSVGEAAQAKKKSIGWSIFGGSSGGRQQKAGYGPLPDMSRIGLKSMGKAPGQLRRMGTSTAALMRSSSTLEVPSLSEQLAIDWTGVDDLVVDEDFGDESGDEGSVAEDTAAEEETDSALRYSPQNPLLVLGVDSGTWPADGGGVASCRRDVINRLPRERWLEIAEVGSPMKLVQGSYQIERNVASLTFVPLWGIDLGGPNQTVLSNVPYGQLATKVWRTTPSAIARYFVPIITQVANGCVLTKRNTTQLDDATQLFVSMYLYFQKYDWSMTWESPLVHEAWRKAWLHLEHARLHSEEGDALQRELPTLEDIDFALSLVMHFMMPITVPLPKVPVVHSSHHGIQSVIGAVAKQVNHSSFIVWDHGVLWRERLLALSEISSFPLFVRNVLVGVTRICVAVTFHNVDIVVPCCSTNNPDWEARLGGHGNDQYTTNMWRHISPVINGMETDRFHPHHDTELDQPCAVMLSHVYDLKDVKNAIRAANEIVNTFKLTSYKLLIYGGLDKDLEYTDDCRAIIADNGLAGNVTLCGLGNAPVVLPQGWLFLNSSKSEGLPLALGEAGLCGMPVVCTDVGGSREVVTDNGVTCGAVSPARNAEALARAQLNVLACLGHLEKLGKKMDGDRADDHEDHEDSPLVMALQDFAPLKRDGPSLEARMHSVRAIRQRVGMRYRAYILRQFTMKRYLREHEQLMWIGAMRSRERIGSKISSLDKTDAAIDVAGLQPPPAASPDATTRPQTIPHTGVPSINKIPSGVTDGPGSSSSDGGGGLFGRGSSGSTGSPKRRFTLGPGGGWGRGKEKKSSDTELTAVGPM